MYGYIYLTTCLLNNKIYIGQHVGSKFDINYYGSGSRLRKALKKYGISNFRCRILEECDSREALNEREVYWISYYKSTNPKIGYNITNGGGGIGGYQFTEKFKKEQSERTRKQNLARDPSVYQRVSESAKGNKMMNKDGVCKRVHPQDFNYYLSQGWVFGGLKRNVDRTGSRNPAFGKSYVKDRIWMYKGSNRLYIHKSLYNEYKQSGWTRGMKNTQYYKREDYLSR